MEAHTMNMPQLNKPAPAQPSAPKPISQLNATEAEAMVDAFQAAPTSDAARECANDLVAARGGALPATDWEVSRVQLALDEKTKLIATFEEQLRKALELINTLDARERELREAVLPVLKSALGFTQIVGTEDELPEDLETMAKIEALAGQLTGAIAALTPPASAEQKG